MNVTLSTHPAYSTLAILFPLQTAVSDSESLSGDEWAELNVCKKD
jgi:hypothetical protein